MTVKAGRQRTSLSSTLVVAGAGRCPMDVAVDALVGEAKAATDVQGCPQDNVQESFR